MAHRGIATGSGLPALAVYSALIAATLGLLRRHRRDDPSMALLAAGVGAALVAHLVGDFFITAEVTGSWLFWLLIGSTAAIASPT